MKLQHPHTLGKAEAKRRVERLTQYWHERYGVQVQWDGDRASVNGNVKGFPFDARVTVSEAAIDAEGSDPGFLMRTAATAYLKSKLADYLDPAKSEDEVAKLS